MIFVSKGQATALFYYLLKRISTVSEFELNATNGG